jgi:predicted DCC family thiol-disulfide oxidoreductase YuxK
VVWFSQIPAELRVAPIGLGWLLDYLPINPTWVRVSSTLLLVCSFTAMIGLFTCTSALLTVVLSFYVLGIPQFYGKVNSYHHLLWFAAILAACRCGDTFSCDALIAAWRRADHGSIDPPGVSQMYALPLRFVWLLMGVMYFFAGCWKFWSSGVDWALSENLKFVMYQKWTELDGWTPFFRIDQYPFLYKAAALGTIVFEISFVFLLFSRRLRFLAPLGGIIFHTMTEVFMRISFSSLVRCYVVFFDWHAIFRRMGCWLYGEEMYVLYDGNCQLCRRTIASLQVFDIFGRVLYVNACDDEAVKDHGLQWLHSPALMADMHVIIQQKVWRGFAAYRALAFRIPILWPAVPFLYLWPVPTIANRVYRHVADSRTCSIAHALSPQAEKTEYTPQLGFRTVTVVGVFLLFATILASIGDVGSSWPIARYPTFAGIAGPEIDLVEISVQSAGGETIPLNGRTLSQNIDSTRFLGLMGQVLSAKTEAQRRIRVKALWRLWMQNDPSLQQASSVRFYKVTLSAIPEQWKTNPLHRELLLELTL